MLSSKNMRKHSREICYVPHKVTMRCLLGRNHPNSKMGKTVPDVDPIQSFRYGLLKKVRTVDDKVKSMSNFRFLPLTEMPIEGISYRSKGKLIGFAQTQQVINNRHHRPTKIPWYFWGFSFIPAIYARVPLVVIVCFTRFTKVITNKTRNQIVWKCSFHLIQTHFTFLAPSFSSTPVLSEDA